MVLQRCTLVFVQVLTAQVDTQVPGYSYVHCIDEMTSGTICTAMFLSAIASGILCGLTTSRLLYT